MLYVSICQESNESYSAQGRRLVDLTGDLARYTFLLFCTTLLLALATRWMVRVGFLQVRDAQDSIAATKERSLLEIRTALAFISFQVPTWGMSA